jgi:hypothetical protein
MRPVARVRLDWTDAAVPQSRIIETEAGVNVWIFFEEGFASIMHKMVMMMMIRTGHHGRRMVEFDMLAREWFCSVRCVRARACVRIPVIGRSGAEGSAMRTGRSPSSSQSCATVMAASAVTATTAAVTAATAASAASATTGARGRRRSASRISGSRGEDRTDENQRSGEYDEPGKHGISPNQPM